MCAECDATSQVRRKELALVMGYTVGGALLCLLSRMGVFVWCGPRAKTPEKEAERSKQLEEWIAKDREVVAQHGGYPYRPGYATIISKCASPWLLECPHCHQEFQHRDTYAQQFTMERPTRCPNPECGYLLYGRWQHSIFKQPRPERHGEVGTKRVIVARTVGVQRATESVPSSLTWGERIYKAPDIRKAYPPKRLSDCRGPYQ
jgi:hypothetical protein